MQSNLGLKSKILPDIETAVKNSELKDGMTISFHHHLREGDYVMKAAMEAIRKLGIKNLTLSVSSLLSCHGFLMEYIHDKTITSIKTSGIRGDLAKAISYDNILGKPVIFRTHGGRAAAIETGIEKIDVAFMAASAADKMGNMTGRRGKSAFGSMGYAMVDCKYARHVVCITDTIEDYPLIDASIDQTYVDSVVVIDSIGDASKIASGATRFTENERELLIASYAAKLLIASKTIKNGFSFQAGSGGASLAVIRYLKDYMKQNNIQASFASGGITSVLTDLLQEGYFNALLDTQSFDEGAARSLSKNKNHIEMSASMYASPFNKGCVCNLLDAVILSATEVDLNFNVNVLTGSNGVIMGAQGGHPDTAAGASLRIITIPIERKGRPIVLDKVTTIVTKGEYIDAIVSDKGIAINPRRTDLLKAVQKADLPIVTIDQLRKQALDLCGEQPLPKYCCENTIVGIVEGRDGEITDVIYQVKKEG